MSLEVGDKVPNFSAKDQHGSNFIWDEHLGKPIVLYFYPKDDTPGCTAQACGFRDEYEDFKEKYKKDVQKALKNKKNELEKLKKEKNKKVKDVSSDKASDFLKKYAKKK